MSSGHGFAFWDGKEQPIMPLSLSIPDVALDK
jgi:hypothetical protein